MRELILDIETAPNIADVWDLFNVGNISLSQLRESSYTLCWAAKWRGAEEVRFGSQWGNPNRYINDIYGLIDAADVVTTYNGDRFDLPTLNKEFVLKGWGPPAPYKSLDIYKTIKSKFKFPSGKLEYVSNALGVGNKVKHSGHSLWVRVMAGDPVAQAEFEEYNRGDVVLLEKLEDKILPWVSDYPNQLLHSGSDCVRCGVGHVVKRGFHETVSGRYQAYRCANCGSWSRDTKRTEGVNVRAI